MRKHMSIGWVAAAVLIAVLAAPAAAAPNIKVKGTLEEVQEHGHYAVITTAADRVDVVLREHRAVYQVSSYAAIINGFGRKASLESFSLPAKVEFEVEYTAGGPIIKKIREIPQ